jgi:hypothetical protein
MPPECRVYILPSTTPKPFKLQYASYAEVADALQFKSKKRSRLEWEGIIAT